MPPTQYVVYEVNWYKGWISTIQKHQLYFFVFQSFNEEFVENGRRFIKWKCHLSYDFISLINYAPLMWGSTSACFHGDYHVTANEMPLLIASFLQ